MPRSVPSAPGHHPFYVFEFKNIIIIIIIILHARDAFYYLNLFAASCQRRQLRWLFRNRNHTYELVPFVCVYVQCTMLADSNVWLSSLLAQRPCIALHLFSKLCSCVHVSLCVNTCVLLGASKYYKVGWLYCSTVPRVEGKFLDLRWKGKHFYQQDTSLWAFSAEFRRKLNHSCFPKKHPG